MKMNPLKDRQFVSIPLVEETSDIKQKDADISLNKHASGPQDTSLRFDPFVCVVAVLTILFVLLVLAGLIAALVLLV